MSPTGSYKKQSSQQVNGSYSGPSEESGATSVQLKSQYAAQPATTHSTVVVDLTPYSGGDERPVTSHSGKSTSTGKVKKRLSLLSMGMGRSGSSSKDGSSGHGVDAIQE